MQKTTKIAISLPKDVFDTIEHERKISGESRSELFRRAIIMLLRSQKERSMNERYIHAYIKQPETEDEVEVSRRNASDILAKEPWQ